MKSRHPAIKRCCFALALIALTLANLGCGANQPSRFYLLNASSALQSSSQSSSATLDIGLGPITFPPYLDRSTIMVRTGGNSFRAAQYHRWAEPLETNFARVLTQELRNSLPDATVATYPWRYANEIEVQIVLEVISFDSDDNDQARLDVRWKLIDANKKPLAPPQQREYIKTARSSDYEGRVAAMSECVAALGQELGQEVMRVQAGGHL